MRIVVNVSSLAAHRPFLFVCYPLKKKNGLFVIESQSGRFSSPAWKKVKVDFCWTWTEFQRVKTTFVWMWVRSEWKAAANEGFDIVSSCCSARKLPACLPEIEQNVARDLVVGSTLIAKWTKGEIFEAYLKFLVWGILQNMKLFSTSICCREKHVKRSN